jgi:RNA polymerase sigma factor (TIGR02999 family)
MSDHAPDHRGDVTRLLAELGRGGQAVVDRVLPIVYDELRQIAHRHLQGERRDHTLDTNAVVHEAYVKLVGLNHMTWQNRAHFLAIAAQAMRRVLVDYAVSRKAQKRGGTRHRLDLDEVQLAASEPSETVVALDAALRRLEATNIRLSRIVECRYFAGMSIDETARALDVSPATVKRDWQMARAWLNRELKSEP